jgi:uncharacterized protein (TIGR00296 family)
MLTLNKGIRLVKLARYSVEKWLEKKFVLETNEELSEKKGVFITIESFPDKSLRGCIGFPYPELPICEAVQRAAISSAFEDPRFEPLTKNELNSIVFEVSVLTEPKLMGVKSPEDYAKRIEIGRDGLMISNGPFSGLLLPIVPVTFNWNAEEFLDNLAYKAGLTPDCLHDKKTKIWTFQTQIFSEKRPNGEIVELKLTKHCR